VSLLALLTLSAEASGQGTEATWVGEFSGNVRDVVLAGQRAYLATDEGLVVVDLTNLSQPEKVGEYQIEGGADTLTLDGVHVYLGTADGLWIVNVSVPASPTLLGNMSLPGQTHDIAVEDGLAYLACGEQGLWIVNVSDPASPDELGSHVITGTAQALFVEAGVAFVAWGEAGLLTLDVSDPENPEPMDALEITGEAMGLAVREERLYLAVDDSGLYEVDISDPDNLGQYGFFSTLEDRAQNVILAGKLGMVAVGDRGVQFIDIDSPAAGWTGSFDTPGTPLAIEVEGRYAFIADGTGGLQVVTFNSLPVVTIFSITPSPASAGESVTFRGAGHDPDGTIASHLWTSSLDGELGQEATFATTQLTQGRHIIHLRVCDNDGACSHEVSQALQVGNARPTAAITMASPAPAIEDDTVYFAGQGQDQDGHIMAYEWSSSLQGLLDDGVSFSTDGLVPGDHIITFRVRDDDGSWSEAVTTSVLVKARPLLSLGNVEPVQDDFGQHHIFNVTYIDPETGAAPEVLVTILHHGSGTFTMSDPEADGTYSYTATDLRWGYHNFSFQATSPTGARAKGDTGAHELYVNALPRATIQTITPSPATQGANATLTGRGTDLDGSIKAHRWSSDLDGDLGVLPTLTLANLSVGEHVISLRVRDDTGAWSPAVESRLMVEKGTTPPPPGKPFLTSPEVVQIGVATSTLTLSGLAVGFLVYGESFRYRYWALLAPLMVGHRTELSPTDPLANEIRGLIRGYLLAHPGSHYNLLKDELGLVNGTLAYHLQVLEREGLVTSEREGRMRHFFAIGKGVDTNGHKPKVRGRKFARWTGGGWRRGTPNGHPPKPEDNGDKGDKDDTGDQRTQDVKHGKGDKGAKDGKDTKDDDDGKDDKGKKDAKDAKDPKDDRKTASAVKPVKRNGARPVTKERLLELVLERPGVSQTELAEAFSVTSAAVKYHLDGLLAKEELRFERTGNRMEYYIVDKDEPAPPDD